MGAKCDLLSFHRLVIGICGAAFALTLLASAAPAIAEEDAASAVNAVAGNSSPLSDRLLLRMGGYHARDADTILRRDSNSGSIGTSIDFNENLGGETEATVFRIDGLYRFNDRHAVAAAWYDLRFKGVKTLDRDINWGDLTFPISTRLDSNIEYKIYKLNYQYSLFHNETAELGASFGLHIMNISLGMAGSSSFGFDQTYNDAVTAPLPVFGLFAEYNFSPRLKTFYNYQIFGINYDNTVKGGLQDFLIGLEYRSLKNLGIGVAYNRLSADLEIKKEASTLSFNTNWNGIMLYGSVYY